MIHAHEFTSQVFTQPIAKNQVNFSNAREVSAVTESIRGVNDLTERRVHRSQVRQTGGIVLNIVDVKVQNPLQKSPFPIIDQTDFFASGGGVSMNSDIEMHFTEGREHCMDGHVGIRLRDNLLEACHDPLKGIHGI